MILKFKDSIKSNFIDVSNINKHLGLEKGIDIDTSTVFNYEFELGIDTKTEYIKSIDFGCTKIEAVIFVFIDSEGLNDKQKEQVSKIKDIKLNRTVYELELELTLNDFKDFNIVNESEFAPDGGFYIDRVDIDFQSRKIVFSN